jgi:hypothetical protein
MMVMMDEEIASTDLTREIKKQKTHNAVLLLTLTHHLPITASHLAILL